MDAIRVIHDTEGHTLTIWLDDPAKESVCEETSDEVVVMKDAGGNVIGVEILHYRPALQNNRISVELLRTPAP
jgi:uncharacterized protein YuzE